MGHIDKVNIEMVKGSSSIKVEAHSQGKAVIKHTTADSLSAVIAQNIEFNTGILPKGTRFFGGVSTNYSILIETAPMLKVLNLFSYPRSEKDNKYKGHSETVPFPHLLFYFRVINETINYSNIFALKRSLKDTRDDLYIFPYGNVYSNGNVCWGSALKNRKITNPMKLIDVIARFLDSQYNADLFDTHTINTKELKDFGDSLSFWKFIEYMKKEKVFPVNALRRSDTKLAVLL